jgi:adsorption protein B
VTGISLQGWARHGWRVPLKQVYWLWRDRKGLLGNLLTPVLNGLFGWSVVSEMLGEPSPARLWSLPGLEALGFFSMTVSCLQLAVRAACVRRVYTRSHALLVPFRAVFGNALNCASTMGAVWRFCAAKLRGRPLVWLKTEHMYPTRAVLTLHAPPAEPRVVPFPAPVTDLDAEAQRAPVSRSR